VGRGRGSEVQKKRGRGGQNQIPKRARDDPHDGKKVQGTGPVKRTEGCFLVSAETRPGEQETAPSRVARKKTLTTLWASEQKKRDKKRKLERRFSNASRTKKDETGQSSIFRSEGPANPKGKKS